MEYRKITNLLDNAPNQATKFRTKISLKQMMPDVERISLIVKLNLKPQF